MSSDCDYAWAAGFFDGEGTMDFRYYAPAPSRRATGRTGGSWVLKIQVTNTDMDSLVRFQKIFGFGTIHDSRSKTKPLVGRPCFQWCVTANAAFRFLNMVRPFVFTKSKQVDCALLAIEILKTTPRPKKRITPETHAEMRRFSDQMHDLRLHHGPKLVQTA